ncbi:MAG: glycosyltransferase family 4 protein [Actinomycetia bacterium]|nr:glycosyltransferase family 4 protein [Actinomycetes bacterium]
MKILLIHNYYRHRGGEDIAFDNQKEMLSREGIDIEVYSKSSKSLNNIFRKLASLCSLFYSLRTKKDIKKLISEHNPDIAHIHNVYPLISSSVYDVLHKNNIPIVQTIHNYRFFCANGLCIDRGRICEKCENLSFRNVFTDCRRDNRLYNFLLALNLYILRKGNIYSRISRFIALSEFVKGKMINTGIDKNKIEVISNIIDLPEVVRDKKTGLEPYFLYMGRLSHEKGIMELFKVFGELKNVRIKILGDGPLRKEIEEKIKLEGLKNIDLLGYVDGEEKYRIIGSAAATIIPSVCYEVSPLVIMESFKSGIPIIVNNIGSLPENIAEGKNGFIYNSLEELKEKISYMLKLDVIRKSEMSEYTRESYGKYFNPDKNLKKLTDVYQKILEEKNE